MPTVLVRVPLDVGASIARDLVENRLAASANRVNCTSTYRWDGDVEIADEEILLVQTTDDRYDDVVEFVADRHPYDVPSIERFDESDAPEDFLTWRQQSVTSRDDAE